MSNFISGMICMISLFAVSNEFENSTSEEFGSVISAKCLSLNN